MAVTFTALVSGASAIAKLSNDVVKAEVLVDLTLAALAGAVTTDVIQCIKVPENAIVTKVGWYTVVADTTAQATIGDATTANGWDAAADFTTIGNNGFSLEGTDTYALGKFYTVADTIDITLSADSAEIGKIMVFAEYSVASTNLVA